MSNKEFADRLQKRMNESVYGFGAKMMPVNKAAWPEPESEPVQEELPSNSQTVVTNGDTTKLGDPRSDLAAQGGELDQETMAEVANLLITIGFLLQKAGAVGDKYDTAGVIAYLNGNNFGAGCASAAPAPTSEVPEQPPVADAIGVEVPSVVAPEASATVVAVKPEDEENKNLPSTQVGPAAFYEARKLLESKFKK